MDVVNGDIDRDDSIASFDAIYADKTHRDYEYGVDWVCDCIFFGDGYWYNY